MGLRREHRMIEFIKTNAFPCVIIALYICAAVHDGARLELAKALYWLAAAVVNAAVLMM